jgi:hypothetical protein
MSHRNPDAVILGSHIAHLLKRNDWSVPQHNGGKLSL